MHGDGNTSAVNCYMGSRLALQATIVRCYASVLHLRRKLAAQLLMLDARERRCPRAVSSCVYRLHTLRTTCASRRPFRPDYRLHVYAFVISPHAWR